MSQHCDANLASIASFTRSHYPGLITTRVIGLELAPVPIIHSTSGFNANKGLHVAHDNV